MKHVAAGILATLIFFGGTVQVQALEQEMTLEGFNANNEDIAVTYLMDTSDVCDKLQEALIPNLMKALRSFSTEELKGSDLHQRKLLDTIVFQYQSDVPTNCTVNWLYIEKIRFGGEFIAFNSNELRWDNSKQTTVEAETNVGAASQTDLWSKYITIFALASLFILMILYMILTRRFNQLRSKMDQMHDDED
ncbi:hypothetical protein COT97_05855 [Candidatus Falkowbacteria bacterium CG10_big_fil_rev_8_21_14_0_10_39_11]|uniref:Transmembrane protein n=1 Tax=Candidatus Falkowbacteria bacterium CG10_big_fil_rev_8_21_14_0_10_39_11 TaxID=1974565 RepID=A0A2H0V3C2_9BACT|nr:MAG: hypothetical protein COT97_05855 [Candidatus Falkowbacteria bacterium CG10_big_fil_rev_8_21_14_0_10_39_11]